MAFEKLSERDQKTVFQCMLAILEGNHIGGGFHSRLGLDRSELREVVSVWPALDDSQIVVELAINNCLNEVLHGIGMTPDEWSRWIDQPKEEVLRVYQTWARLKGRKSTGIR